MIKLVNGEEVYSYYGNTLVFWCGECEAGLIVKPKLVPSWWEGQATFKIDTDDMIDCPLSRQWFDEKVSLDNHPEKMALYEKHQSSWHLKIK